MGSTEQYQITLNKLIAFVNAFGNDETAETTSVRNYVSGKVIEYENDEMMKWLCGEMMK